jgi:lipoprotein-releasing system permease protein
VRARLLLTIAVRQLVSRSHSGVVRTVSVLSVSGIAIGVASLLLLQAFMTGFQRSIAGFLSSANPPLIVYAPASESIDPGDISMLRRLVRSNSGLTAVSPFIEKAAVAAGNNGEVAGVIVRGVDWSTEFEVTGLASILGSEPPGAVVGRNLALRLGLAEGDSIRVASTESATISATGRAVVDTILVLPVSRICDFGLEEYNSGLVMTSLSEAEALFDLRGCASSAGVGVAPGIDPVSAAASLGASLRSEYVQSGYPRFLMCDAFIARHENLFRAFGLERLAMTIVLGLITVVALLNLSSALSMISMEHRRDLGVLRAMGAPPGSILGMALFQGLLIGASGCLLGCGFALGIQHLVNTILPIRLEGSVYWIEALPASLLPGQAAAVLALTLAACLLASLFPAVRALGVPPAECVRNE